MIADPSETSAGDLAAGDVSGLSRPLYFACGHEIERLQFLEMHALAPHEVLRIRHPYQIPAQCPPGKVLVLAPRWGEDRATAAFVTWWVARDRYTFAIELEPVPAGDSRFQLRWGRFLAAGCALAALVSFIRGADPVAWLAAAAGWAAFVTRGEGES
jgi:hypothetical protein